MATLEVGLRKTGREGGIACISNYDVSEQWNDKARTARARTASLSRLNVGKSLSACEPQE